MKSKEELLSIKEAAKLAGVNDETVARWVRKSRLKAEKMRIKGLKEEWRIEKKDFLEFINE